MNKLICIVGMCGSGKSVVADEFVKEGYGFLRFGQLVLDEFIKRKTSPTEKMEKEIREGFRKQHGPAAMAILNIPKFDELLKKGNVVGDGLYSWSEYKVLKERYGDRFKVIAVYAPPKVRYERLSTRKTDLVADNKYRNRYQSVADSIARDYAEIENIEKGGPIAMADYLIVNTGTKEDTIAQTKKIIAEIELL